MATRRVAAWRAALALSAPHDIVGVVALSGRFDLTASTGSYDKRVDPLFSDAPDEDEEVQ